MITYVFPGQGSQSKGMGGTLFDEFRELTKSADEILGYSIKELCLRDPNTYLGQTQYTQPAIYTVNVLTYLKRVQETGIKPDFVAGHSLGEYSALFAAGAYDFVTGLKLVKKRGELMSKAYGGAMAAVIGLDEEKLMLALKENGLLSIDAANYNSPYQIVISGLKEDIDKAKGIFEGIPGVKMFIPLKTSGAFHSRYMENAQKEFESFLHTFRFSEISIPIISNVKARPYNQSEIKENLIKQMTCPVKWTESIRYLMGIGEMKFEEIGLGKVLTGLIQKIEKEAEPLQVTKAEIENLLNKPENGQISSVSEDAPAFSLGNPEFKRDYNLKYAYMAGGMYRGISSKEMVVKMGRAGMIGFFGTGGLDLQQVEAAIKSIQNEFKEGQAYGMNLVHHSLSPEHEEKTIDLYLKTGVTIIEAAAFLSVTPALIKYHAKGLSIGSDGKVKASNKIIAKVSRPEVAEAFLSPAPQWVVDKLVAENKITPKEAEMSREVPVADDICAEADSAGHTDGATAYALVPAMIKLRDDMVKKYEYHRKPRVGAAGGIGTPEAAAAAFILGADFIVTGSINQCTVEAATSDTVKDLLSQMNVQDTEYAPAGDMFELGAKVQVLKKGLFFPARANKLYDLYRTYNSISEIDEKTRTQIQEKYFKRSFDEVYQEVKTYYPTKDIEKAEQNPKYKMALIFRWYFGYSSRLALNGTEDSRVDFQIHCGPALGAFNQWVKGTELENWRNRHVDKIGEKIMVETALLLKKWFESHKA